ncbi:MAG TPA: TIR domain-containing protein [Longimicrobium sp.]|nr:TIR domain-containing protein [Longimicrobium sp.]
MKDKASASSSRTNRAFFSYARADQRLANWLWRELDRFRTPKDLVDTEGAFGRVPAKLHPIFRDREDLASRGKTVDLLTAALEDSDALIVLCTPESAKSEWVNKEVQIFQSFGPPRSDRIFPVVGTSNPKADRGLPLEDFFPPSLKNSGLLAADLRDFHMPGGQVVGDGKEEGRLKLIAGLLGVSLNALVRRERTRQRRVIASLTAAAIAFAGVATAAVWLGLLANRNADRAQAQSDRSLSLLWSAQSQALSGENDQRALLLSIEAVKATARHGLVVPSARAALQHAFSRVSGVGLSGHRDNVILASFSDDERKLATGSFDEEVRVWDISNPDAPRSTSILPLPDMPRAVLFDRAGANVVTLSGSGTSRTQALVWRVLDAGRYPSSRPLLQTGSPHDAIAASQEVIAVAGVSGEITLVSRADLSHTNVLRVLRAPRAGDIAKLAFSKDGRILLAGTKSSHVWIWDLTHTRATPVTDIFANHRLPRPVVQPAKIDILGISDDCTTLFTASSDWFDGSTGADLDLKLWSLQALKPVGSPIFLSHRGAPNSSAIQSAQFIGDDENHLLSVSMDGRVRSWRVGRFSGVPSGNFVSGEFAHTSALSPDGAVLALSADNEVRVLHVSELLGSGNTPNPVSLSGFDGGVSFVSFSNSGRFLVAGGLDATVRLWDVEREDPNAYVPSARLSPYAPARNTILTEDGAFGVLLKPKALEFWHLRDPTAPTLVRSVALDSTRSARIGECLACTVLVAPNQRWVAIQSTNRDQSEIVELKARGRDFPVNARLWTVTQEIEFSPDGRWLLVDEAQGVETIYDLHTTPPATPARTVVNLPAGSYSRELSPDSRHVLYRRYVNPYQDRTGRELSVGVLVPLTAVNDLSRRREINGFATGIGSAVFSEDGQWVALSGNYTYPDRSTDDTVIRLLRLNVPNAEYTLTGHEFAASAQFSRNGRWLLTASEDMTLRDARTQARLWRLDTNRGAPTAQVLPGVSTFLHAAQLSPDGRFLVTISGAGPTARLWRLTDKASLVTTLAVPAPENNWHYKIVFGQDGKTLVISGIDNPTPYFWSLDEVNIPSRGLSISNGDREIRSIDFTPDGERLIILNSGGTTGGVSGTAGSHVTIVELATFPDEGSSYQAFEVSDEIGRVAYRDDLGLLLAQGSSLRGQWIRIEEMLQRAERAVGRNLTLDEWIKTGTLEMYRPTFPRLPVDAGTLQALPGVIARLREEHPGRAEQLTDDLIAWTNQRDEADVCNNVARDFARQRNGSAALECLGCAIAHFPDDHDYRETRGIAFALLGRRDSAIADFEFYVRAYERIPQYADDVERRRRWIRALQAQRDPFPSGID